MLRPYVLRRVNSHVSNSFDGSGQVGAHSPHENLTSVVDSYVSRVGARHAVRLLLRNRMENGSPSHKTFFKRAGSHASGSLVRRESPTH
jgi:hypothetical protein